MKVKLFAITVSAIALFALFLGCTAQQKRVLFQPGETVFVSKCNSCHLLPKIDSQVKKEWDEIIRKHEEKRVQLSDSERTLLIGYLSKAEGGIKDR